MGQTIWIPLWGGVSFDGQRTLYAGEHLFVVGLCGRVAVHRIAYLLFYGAEGAVDGGNGVVADGVGIGLVCVAEVVDVHVLYVSAVTVGRCRGVEIAENGLVQVFQIPCGSVVGVYAGYAASRSDNVYQRTGDALYLLFAVGEQAACIRHVNEPRGAREKLFLKERHDSGGFLHGRIFVHVTILFGRKGCTAGSGEVFDNV